MLLQNISAEHSPCCVLGGIFTEPRGTAQATLASQLLGSGITQTTMLSSLYVGSGDPNSCFTWSHVPCPALPFLIITIFLKWVP